MPTVMIFAESYHFSMLISDIKFSANKDFDMVHVPDKIQKNYFYL